MWFRLRLLVVQCNISYFIGATEDGILNDIQKSCTFGTTPAVISTCTSINELKSISVTVQGGSVRRCTLMQ